MQKLYEAKVIADSIATNTGSRLTSILVTMPRFVLAELNTHRMFSRNSASSRAIPVKRRIDMIGEEPVVPEAFTKNKRGMQADENLGEEADAEARDIWLDCCGYNSAAAARLADLEVHKQHANRLLETWAPHTVLVSSTEWDNFWALRISKNAQPEIHKAAIAMREVFEASTPSPCHPDNYQLPMGWHLPFTDLVDRTNHSLRDLTEIAIGRCARTSTLTFDGNREQPEKDMKLTGRLLKNGHMSPFEHVARPMNDKEWAIFSASFLLAQQHGYIPKDEPVKAFFGNFSGWIQYRKQIPGESVYTGE